jgi:hypothetical protein
MNYPLSIFLDLRYSKKKTNKSHSSSLSSFFREEDNRGIFNPSACKMFNISAVEHLPIDQWSFTKNDTICKSEKSNINFIRTFTRLLISL